MKAVVLRRADRSIYRAVEGADEWCVLGFRG